MKLKKFTLLELLLVIAIILILLSLIIPMVIKAQRSAELVVCMNNLKGIHNANALFGKDNKRYFPTALGNAYFGTGSLPLDKYLGGQEDKIGVCPMDPAETPVGYVASASGSARTGNTFLNKSLDDKVTQEPFCNDLDGNESGNSTWNQYAPNGSNPNSLKYRERRSLKVSKVFRPATMSFMVSKEVYNKSITSDSNNGTIDEYWHDLSTPRYPFVSVAGNVTNLYFYGGLNTSSRTDIVDFQNAP